jgi:hypothetical protein
MSAATKAEPKLSYLDQSEAVKARLDRLKARNVILRVNRLDKLFQNGGQKIVAL